MKTIITPIYNESYLLTYFIKQHSWVDKFIFLVDKDTNDSSRDIIKLMLPNKHEIIEFDFGFDDAKLIKLTNDTIKNTDSTYYICIDADEFIIDIPKFEADYECVLFYQMIQNVETEDKWLNDKPLIEQRKYGEIDYMYLKPCIVKKDANPLFGVGKHTVLVNHKMIIPSKTMVYYKGMHMNYLNTVFTLGRMYSRHQRLSVGNYANGFGKHYFDFNEQDIINKFRKQTQKLW